MGRRLRPVRIVVAVALLATGLAVLPDVSYRITTGPGVAPTYNARGDMLTDTTGAYSYDALGHLTSHGTSTYTWDGLDRLASRNGTGLTYGGLDQAPATDPTSSYTRTPGGTLLAAAITGQPASAALLISTTHGEPVIATNPTAGLVATRAYDPFGTPTAAGGTTPGNLGLEGAFTDPASGQTWLGARWNNPATGTFTSQDTWTGDPTRPVTLNGYTYANANPTTLSDPTGHCAVSPTGWGDCTADTGPRSFAVAPLIGVGVAFTDLASPPPPPMQTPGLPGSGTDSGGDWNQYLNDSDPAAREVAGIAFAHQYAGKRLSGAGLLSVAAEVVADVTGVTDVLDCVGGRGCGNLFLNAALTLATAAAAKAVAVAFKAVRRAFLAVKEASEAIKATMDAVAVDRRIVQGARGVGEAEDAAATRLARSGATDVRGALGDASEASLCSFNSFTADTPVLLADGSTKPIKDVTIDDKVRATDPQTGVTAARPVTQVIRHSGDHTMVTLTLDNGDQLNATDHHPIWDATQGHFVDAIDVTVGDEVVGALGERIPVKAKQVWHASLTAYNLTVSGIHTYYAGRHPVLVHNSCGSAAETAPRFSNLAPEDVVQSFNRIPNVQLSKINGQFNYVVKPDGELVVGRQFNGHIDLAQGGDVTAAGRVRVVNGEIKWFDNASGHYQPSGPSVPIIARGAFERQGLHVPVGAYRPVG